MSNFEFVKEINPASLTTPNSYTVVIDGADCKTEKDFFDTMWRKMHLPIVSLRTWSSLTNWLCDLSWLKEDTINIVIQNFNTFLCASPKAKQVFASHTKNGVVSYWNKEALNISGEEPLKNINVYCVEDASDFVCTQSVVRKIHQNIVSGVKIPHAASQPVIREEDGKYYIAAYVFFYTAQEINEGIVNRPSLWALFDIETGELVKIYETAEYDFSEAPYEVSYDIRIKHPVKEPQSYHIKTFELLDEVRKEYIRTGVLDKAKYSAYLDRVTSNIPESYKRFFTDLSVNI